MLKRLIITVLAAVALIFGLSACDTPNDPSPAQKAIQDRERSVTSIREQQPVQGMNYSSTLDTINKWAKTWGNREAVAYVYMQRGDGSMAGYYVLDGEPVSMCTSGSPPYEMQDLPGDGTTADAQVDAPGLDGAYYGGCDASRYYGFDAVTGQYVSYTDGMVLTAIVSDQPLPLSKQPQPFVSSIEDVQRK